MKIQYASDLHIDEWPKGTPFKSFITPAAPVLVLAGDICPAWNPLFKYFLRWCSQRWHRVIFVPGNHEYRNKKRKTILDADLYMNSVCNKFPNVTFLQNGMSYCLSGTCIRFVGATLWSHIDEAIWHKAAKKKGDCQLIYYNSLFETQVATPAFLTALHSVHKTLLSYALHPMYFGEIVVAVTHHMPTKKMLEEEYVGETWHTFYASDDDDLFFPNVAFWICGHGHRAAHYRALSGTQIVMNARGYNDPAELNRKQDIFNPRAVCIVPRTSS